MATAYTSDRKIGALESASTPLAATNELVINQNGDTVKTPLSAIEAKVFDAKTATTTPTGTEVVVVRQTDNSLRQVALSNIVPALNITNGQVSGSAAIADTKLATIATAGKVANSATTATNLNTANAIVTRDGSGNFLAGTITATLAGSATGNAGTATKLATARTIAISGDVTATGVSFDGSDNITISAAITGNSILNADINSGAAIVDTKLATIATAGKVANSATTATNLNTANAIVARDASRNFSAGTITADLVGDVTGDVTGNVAGSAGRLAVGGTIGMTGDVVYVSSVFNGTAGVTGVATIATDAVTFAKMQNSAAAGLSVVGRSTNSAGDFSEISAATDGHVLRRSGVTVGFGQTTTGGIADDAVTFAKMQNSAAAGLSVVGRSTNSAGDFSEIDAGADGHVLRRSGVTVGFGQIVSAGIATDAVTVEKLATAVRQALVPVGAVEAFARSTAPSGWLAANGSTIGSASSGATNASADYSALFTVLWDNWTNTLLPILNSAGAASTRGASASADFAANKRLPLPDLRGYFARGWGVAGQNGANSDGTVSGAFGEKQADATKRPSTALTGTTNTTGLHTHPHGRLGAAVPGTFANNITNYPGGETSGITGSSGNHSHTVTIDGGGDTETRPKNIALLYCIKF